MPRVEQFGASKVTTQVTPGARASANVPAEAFGGGSIVKGVADLAGGFIKLKERLDTTAAEEALVSFERDKNNLFFNPDDGYFNTQGRNAYDSAGGASKSLEDLKRSYQEGLDSETSKRVFGKTADLHISRGNVDIMRHSSKGLQAWEVATIQSQVENTVENASLYWNDPDRLRVQNALGRQAVIDSAEIEGVGSEALNERLQTYDSAFTRSAISSATAQDSVSGQALFDKMSDRLEGPDQVKMQKEITAKQKSEKTQQDAQVAVLKATNLVDQYDTRSEILTEIDKIEDPELQKKTRTEAMSQFSRKKQAQSEDRDEFYQTAIEHVNGGGSAEEFKATDPEAWEGMDSKQRNNILSGKHMITDQVLLNDLLTLSKTELAKVTPTDHSSDLKPTDLQKLSKAVVAAKKGQPITTVQSLSAKVNSISEQFFGKKKGWKKRGGGLTSKGESASAFMATVQDVVQDAEELKGGKLSPREVDDVLADFTRKVTLERSRFGVDFLAADLDIDLSTLPANEVRAFNQAVDTLGDNVDKNGLNAAREFLIESNVEVTPRRLVNAYKQGIGNGI